MVGASIPLFSPSQAPTYRETVLHSIFSPSMAGGITSATLKNKYDKATRGRKKKHRIKQAATRLTAKTPSPATSRRTCIPPTELLDLGSPIDFLSPPGLSCDRPLFGPLERNWAPPLDSAPTVPSSPSLASPLGLFSPISASTALSPSSSAQTLTMDKLSFDYVSSCDNMEDLEQVVAALSASAPRRYPSLLRSAQKRLQVLRDAAGPGPVPNEHVKKINNDENKVARNLRFVEKKTGEMATSLTKMDDRSPNPGATDTPVTVGDDASLAMTLSSSSVASDNNDKAPQQSPSPDSGHGRPVATERRAEPHVHDLWVKLQALETAKVSTENDLRVLEDALSETTSEMATANKILAKTQRENTGLRHRLNEQEAKLRGARERERTLQQSLLSKSEQQERSTATAEEMCKTIESRVRQRYEGTLAQQKREVSKLTLLVGEMRQTVQNVTEERDDILQAIQLALGEPHGQYPKIGADSKQARKHVVETVKKTLASFRTVEESLSKATSSFEVERKNFLKAKQFSQRKLDESRAAIKQLHADKLKLEEQLGQFSHGAQDKEGTWEHKENEYKSKIRSLRAQIRSGDAMISMQLYRKAIAESRARTAECEEKRKEVQVLSERLASLQQKVANHHAASSRLNSATRRVARVSPSEVVSSEKSSVPPPPPHRNRPRLSYRLTAVSDGRAGLRARLQRIRGPPSATKVKSAH